MSNTNQRLAELERLCLLLVESGALQRDTLSMFTIKLQDHEDRVTELKDWLTRLDLRLEQTEQPKKRKQRKKRAR